MQSTQHSQRQARWPIVGARRATLAIAAISVAFLLAACGASTKPATSTSVATIKDGGALRAALTGEPDVLDPATSSIYTGAQVYEGIFSKLIDMDASG